MKWLFKNPEKMTPKELRESQTKCLKWMGFCIGVIIAMQVILIFTLIITTIAKTKGI